jgi:antitoxin (DNA-binding transcriptional repressor) of toxin-antitoxin stability system
MGYVSVKDLRVKPADIWEKLKEQGEMILTSNGRPIAILAHVDENDVEATLSALRRARAQAAVARMRRTAAQRGVDQMSEAAIDVEINSVRYERSSALGAT